ncbi:MAG: glycoside hydrolase family 88 protein [Clostridia bacterium]
MNFKKFTAFMMSFIMIISLVPCVSFGASATTVMQSLDAIVLWSCTDGTFNDTPVADAFTGWTSNITSGYVNVKTYSTGNTLQYYVNGTDNITSIVSPGYGSGSEKIIIEWVMKRETTASDLYFDFSFKDINGTEIAFLKLDKNATEPGASHPDENNNEIYQMGWPNKGADCAIVAYNNPDGETHTADYYVTGEKVYTQSELTGTIDGFGSISSSNGLYSTSWEHIGFSNLTIGGVYGSSAKTVTVIYTIGGSEIEGLSGTYVGSEGYTFPKKTVLYDGDVYYADEVTLTESATIELTKYDRYSSKPIGTVFEVNSTSYISTGDSVIANGNFITGNTTGWTSRVNSDVTGGTVSYDSSMDCNVLSISTGGKNDTNTIGTSWSVTAGQQYYLSFYVGGARPTSNNYTYNQVFQSDKTTSILPYGANMTDGEWTRFEEIINPTGDSVYFQCSWVGVIKFANFELVPVEEYTIGQVTKYDVVEDAFVQNNKIYGINTTNTNGVMVGSYSDENRGPGYDANGEATFLEGSTPTTLGSSRVGLMKFPVVKLDEKDRAILNFYVRAWHSQGFDGGNTFLRIALTPLNDSTWADQSEASSFYIASEPLLSNWQTPVFSEKATNAPGYVKVDVTEIMHAAEEANLEYISLKMQIYWGAAYIVEREAALVGGSYEGKGAYIEVSQDEELYRVTTSGVATLTKNGSAMNSFAYVSETDDVRLQLDGADVIGSDEGCYFPGENLTITKDTSITNTIPLGFGLTMVNGAQVRIGGGVDESGKVGNGSGLRFIVTLNGTDTIAGLKDAECGVIITAEGSNAESKIPATYWQNDTVFTAAITNLNPSNYNRKFTATPYVTVNGRTFTGTSVTRSIYQVAAGLLTGENDMGVDAKILYDVLNAYVNQVGIRLSFRDNFELTDRELTVRTSGNGAYTGTPFFEVGETSVDGNIYSIVLTPIGENTVIKNNYWNEYVRINNNNSTIKVCTALEENEDGTYTLSFDTESLNLGPSLKDKFEAMKPTYERAVAAMESANTYWQTNTSYIDWYGSTHPAFWDKAAYHTGNMEMYNVTGNEDYLQYSIDWANYNEWKGNNSTTDPSTWTWGYNQTQGSTAVLFGDWQICFQTYIDLYNLNEAGTVTIEGANIDRVLEVIDYQITKEEDSFWWWADSLYMVMPVMTKLYKTTGDEKYLDALYKYFRYAKELMYDGEGGIPTSAEGYTTSASLSDGAYYSDPDDYKNLFFRDASYVYPLLPNVGHETEKNFWARGDGWVFAGLSKVLSDMPKSYTHYDEFYKTYVEMAEAIISCQRFDDRGYGFWTQSMLQDYPKGSNGNDMGYETSGTAFFVYGLFWGINNGVLTDDAYLKAAVRGWGYLENVALHSDGKVGYVQPIGSKATEAVSYDTTANFGVGAYLLASAEAARWALAQ